MQYKNIIVKRSLPKNYSKKHRNLFSGEFKRYLIYENDIIIENISLFSDGFPYKNFNLNLNFYLPKDYSSFFIIKKILIHIYYFSRIALNFLKKKEIINEESYLICDWHSKGYFHWLVDVLQKIEYLKRNRCKNFKIIIPYNIRNDWVTDSLKVYNFKFIKLEKNKVYLLKKATLIMPKSTSGNPRPDLINGIRNRFRSFYNKFKKKTKKKYKVYVSRDLSNKRKLEKENFFKEFLRKNKFKISYSELKSFKSQVIFYLSCKELIGVHGAGLANMLWMKSSSNIVELRNQDDRNNNCFFSLASALHIKYYYVLCDYDKNYLIYNNNNNNLFLNKNSLQNLIDIDVLK
jgi:hypothetical protein